MRSSHCLNGDLQLWGGIECTYNRVGDVYHNQIHWTGHDRNPEDIDRIADLGIRTLRYPMLWEWAARPDRSDFDWSWADCRMPRLGRAGIRPIVGLLHHGSGPPWTSLIDPGFAEGLAQYAGSFARRFPWVDAYTPVNEPLTTARFSALYGHWYPHKRCAVAFAQALLNQCRATVLSMQAIRAVHSGAKLIQTEDVGKAHSTAALAYQADFENERRWLTFDLLTGRIDRHHPMGSYLLWLGIPEAELLWFSDHPCPPDLLGINYYVTGERFLDERVERYPARYHGGNGRHAYADVEAVRVPEAELVGPEQILLETWERYCLPMAITEAHLACTEDEQMRWLWEIWQAAHAARQADVEVHAVTAWSLLGAYDWDCLVTQRRGIYEAGAFDVSDGGRRATPLAELVGMLTRGTAPALACLEQPGWWRRAEAMA
jgi:dTDP-4-dehydrorhamnose reductase